MSRTLLTALVVLLWGAAPAAAQIPGLREAAGGLLGRVPSLSSFLEGDPPITTSLDDARTEITFLDGWSPDDWQRLDRLPRTARGGFLLRPGRYSMEIQSYCMHAGTHGPGGGDGYLLAPLAGSKAGIVRSLLRNSVARPEIPQRNVQSLIWAIIARTEFDEMPDEMQRTARALLTRDQVKDLDDGALGMVPESVMREAMSQLPPLARQVFEAEARLRSMISSGSSTFAELERVAVLAGAVEAPEGSRPVPNGRWSYHPAGMFVRYDPQGYSRTRIDVSVPRRTWIARDEAGRIVSVTDGSGRGLRIEYGGPSADVPGDAGVKAHALSRIRALDPTEAVIGTHEGGWTLVGVPGGGGRPAGNGFPGLAERYRAADGWRQEWAGLGGRAATGSLKDALDLAQLSLAMQAAPGRTAPGGADDPRAAVALEAVAEAWQSALCGSLGCPSVSGASDVLVLRSGDVRLGRLVGCGGQSCWFEGSPVDIESIAWIGLATTGLPPAVENPDVDEVHLLTGTVRPGELGAISDDRVWTAGGAYERPRVEWIHLAGREETPPTGGSPAGAPPEAPPSAPEPPPPPRDEDEENDEEREEGEDEGGPGGIEFDPSGDAATPGNRARQRLATSGRGFGDAGAGDGGEGDPSDDCMGEQRNLDQAAAQLELYMLQNAECYTDPRAPQSGVEGCTGELVLDDAEQIEYDRLYDVWSEAFSIWTECMLRGL